MSTEKKILKNWKNDLVFIAIDHLIKFPTGISYRNIWTDICKR